MQQILQIPSTSLRLIVACLIVVLLCILHHPFVRDDERMLLWFIVVFGGGISLRRLRSGHRIQSNIVVYYLSPSLPQQLIVASPGRPTPSQSPIESIRKGVGPITSFVPLPSTSCAKEQLEPAIAPSSCCSEGCFISPTAKLTASTATEARGDICDGVGWLLWPSPDDSEAIGHDFGGRSVGWALLREK